MTKRWSHKECFDAYKVKPGNPRWSWSGRSEDGRVVAVTCWRDRFEHNIDLYRSHTSLGEKGWQSRPGHNELIRNLAWARDNRDGEIRIIVAEPVNPLVSPRRIKECWPRPDIRMRVRDLDEVSGDFVLTRIVG